MTSYHKLYHKICRESAYLDPRSADEWLNLFTFYSANLLHFLPLLPEDGHEKYFQQTIQNQRLCLLDQDFFGKGLPVPLQGWDAAFCETLRDRPGIICTMHSGSYRLINYLLARDKIPFALLIASHVIKEQVPYFRDLFSRYMPGRMPEFIDAGDPSSGIRMVRLLKMGVNLLIYMDGDTGLPLTGKEKLLRIPFLGQHVYVRKGIPYLAYKTKVPVYPVFNFRQTDGSITFFHDAPLEGDGKSLNEYSEQVITAVYNKFASLLLHFPAQWENWFRLHQQIDTDVCYMRPWEAGKNRFGLFKKGTEYFLLEKHQYRALFIDQELLERLKSAGMTTGFV